MQLKKFPKMHLYKLKTAGHLYRQSTSFHHYGVRALNSFYFSALQLEACRKTILRLLKLDSEIQQSIYAKNVSRLVKVCFYPDFSMTRKPKESRMGKGKGNVSSYYFPVNKGRLLFEFLFISLRIARRCARLVSYKLATNVRLVSLKY